MKLPKGTKVKVIPRKTKGTSIRKGKIAGYYEKFVCVWIQSENKANIGWHECFLYTDIDVGIVEIVPINSKKNNQSYFSNGEDDLIAVSS